MSYEDDPITNWFREQIQKGPPPRMTPEEAAKELAASLYLIHTEFIKAGFTVEQAFDLTKISLSKP